MNGPGLLGKEVMVQPMNIMHSLSPLTSPSMFQYHQQLFKKKERNFSKKIEKK